MSETIKVRFDLLHAYAEQHRLDFNELCRTVRDAIAEGSAAALASPSKGIAGDAAPQEQPQKDQVHLAGSPNAMVRNSEEERSAFEEFAGGKLDLRIWDDGMYHNGVTQCCWETWQARAALSSGDKESVREQAVAWRFQFPTSNRWHYTEHGPHEHSRPGLIWEPLYASPLPAAQAVRMTDEDRAIFQAVYRKLDEADGGNAPGHAHSRPGIWDNDNPGKGGKPCAWCLTWRKFTALIADDSLDLHQAHQKEGA